MKKLLIIGVLFCIAGCSVLKKDQKRLAIIEVRNPQLLANACAEKYPVVAKEGKPIIKYLPADNKDYTGKIDSLSDALGWMQGLYESAIESHKGDTSCQNTIKDLQARNDSLFRAFMDFKGKYIPCKPDTLRILKTDTVPDLAAIAVRDAQIQDLTAKMADWQKKAEKRGKWNLYLGGFILLLGVGAFVKLKFF